MQLRMRLLDCMTPACDKQACLLAELTGVTLLYSR